MPVGRAGETEDIDHNNSKENMMIVTVGNAKGGVAKTTSVMYLATAWARRTGRRALVLDADPQSSASLWRDMAEDAGHGFELVDVLPANLSTMQRLRGRCASDDLVLVDAPPQGKLLEAAVNVADFVIVPTSDSPLDLQQAWATMAAIPQSVPSAVLVVRAEAGTRAFGETMAALDEQRTPRFDAIVRKRQDIKKGMGTVPAKSWEYAQVLDELMGVAR